MFYIPQAGLRSTNPAYQGFSNPLVGSSYEHPVEQPNSARELMKSYRKDRIPELKLSQFDGNALNWQQWFGQFTSTIDSALMSDDEKSTYVKMLVT